jgi:hypothetical protein
MCILTDYDITSPKTCCVLQNKQMIKEQKNLTPWLESATDLATAACGRVSTNCCG